MARCLACKGEMLKVRGCGKIPVDTRDGKRHDPIMWGLEDDFEHYGHSLGDRCHDCGAVAPGYHHPGCDMERCPACNNQLISCGCLEEAEQDVEITDTQILDQLDEGDATKQ